MFNVLLYMVICFVSLLTGNGYRMLSGSCHATWFGCMRSVLCVVDLGCCMGYGDSIWSRGFGNPQLDPKQLCIVSTPLFLV
jgi:hypothetical protein